MDKIWGEVTRLSLLGIERLKKRYLKANVPPSPRQ